MRLVDTHSHLDVDAFDADREAVVARARDAGVVAQVIAAIDAAGWPRVREVCARHAGLHATYGLHPLFLDAHRLEHLDLLREWIERERPVAIGECGLDFYVDDLDPEAQQRYFEAQLRMAAEYDLPVVVHARRAVEQVLLTVRRIADAHGPLRGVVHSYAGSPEQARQLWDLGFLLGIGGPVTYVRANRIRALVAEMPLEQLLLETDSPDQPNADARGQRNEPARMLRVLDAIAGLRGEPAETIAAATTANARRLFAIDV